MYVIAPHGKWLYWKSSEGQELWRKDLKGDFDYLRRVWNAVESRGRDAHTPALLYEETELVLRTVRDFFSAEIERVVVDERRVYERLCDFFDGVIDELIVFNRPLTDAELDAFHSGGSGRNLRDFVVKDLTF